MRYAKTEKLSKKIRWYSAIYLFLFSTLVDAQVLSETLSLRLGPGQNYPHNTQLASGVDVTVKQWHHDWLLVESARDSGWIHYQIAVRSGVLDSRKAWRRRELRSSPYGSFQGRVFTHRDGIGWSLGWQQELSPLALLLEYEYSEHGKGQWQAAYAWLSVERPLLSRWYYRLALGIGRSFEDVDSRVFNASAGGQDSWLGGAELGLGFTPNHRMSTGFSWRHVAAEAQRRVPLSVLSWSWKVRI